MNIVEHVERGARLCPERVALRAGDTTWTYADLDDTAGRLGAWLRSEGVTEGDRVALRLPNTPSFVLAFLAVLKAGAVAVPLSTRIAVDEVEHILGDSTPVLLLTTASLTAGPVPGAGERPGCRRVLLPERGDRADFAALVENRTAITAADRAPDDPAMLVYTSGTTGRPKGAVLTHHNVVSNTRAKVRCTGLTGADRVLLFLPLYHCYGLNAVLNASFAAHATVVLLPGFDRGRCLGAIKDERVTAVFAVPSVYRVLLDALVAPEDLAGVRYFMSAGAPLPITTQQAWRDRFGLVINEAYGLTETSPFACYNHERRHKVGSVGSPIEDVEIRAVDPVSGEPRPANATGELVVRGPNVMAGYWNDPRATAAVLTDGWFHTGDLGFVDDEGYVFLVDRLNDLLIVDGHNVYPGEVERVLLEHPDIVDAVVYGRRHEVVGDVVCAGVVVRPGASPPHEQLRAFCAARLASFKVPRVLTALDQVPRNATGKPLRRSLSQGIA
ncbi:hypothetical protein ALI22I_13525 [Saccharothrix sp. ALI-22-I]|uniref:class I adenylate-forming enzyme family protein n=1 Tax=Saccharothrix sp. ALI-22-I TaxID=1933778 RepID=UPI00097C55BB|nr:AMP-binding protein [Saccharothrix sp. ALI-22-I]ONI89945.1 hypothetical protein ALI22I_13525 [Saccharothrix sp. ALI-22-I]